MSDIEDDISLGVFSGNFYLQDNLGSETTHYEGIISLNLLNTTPSMGKFYNYARPRAFSSLLGLPWAADPFHGNQCAED
jgi:hypothetical protein